MYYDPMRLFLFFGLFPGHIAARPSSHSEYAVKESHAIPPQWIVEGQPSRSEVISLQIALSPASEGAVQRHLIESSDPSHEQYGQHLTADEVRAMVRPTDESLSLVRAWLDAHGIHNLAHSPAEDWITVNVPISKAEEMLHTSYSRYRHSADGDVLVRAPTWSLPRHLHKHVKLIQPTTSFFRTRKQTTRLDTMHHIDMDWWQNEGKQRYSRNLSKNEMKLAVDDRSVLDSVCDSTFVTPTCIRTLYRTIDYEAKAADKNSIGINNYLNETQHRSDLHQFLAEFRDDEVAQRASNFSIISINNGPDYQGPLGKQQQESGLDQEGDLDGEMVISIGYPTPLVAFNTGGKPPIIQDPDGSFDLNEPYLDFLHYALSQDDLPLILTSSYGDDEQTVPESYADVVCQGFAQLGARGITVIVSSGDDGVGSQDPSNCVSYKTGRKAFLPSFPATCPWVTAVGATQGFNPETAVSVFASGGGFSNYFSAPSYQHATVSRYLDSLHGQDSGWYNRSGRGYPDVAAQGNADVNVWNGQIYTVGGTSAAAPTVAAVLGLVNDALLAEGRPSLGFINPWLYSAVGHTALNDIVSGSSYGCGTDGFPAKKGWDAVTGWGTPDLKRLIDAALSRHESSSNTLVD